MRQGQSTPRLSFSAGCTHGFYGACRSRALLPGHSLPGSSMATWALGRSNGVDSKRAYTTHLVKIVMGDLDRCHEPIRSFSGRLIGPVALSSDVLSCHLLWGGLSSRVPLLSAMPFCRLCFTLVFRNVAKTDPESALGLVKVVLGPPCAKSGCHSQDSDTCSLYPVLRAMSQGGRFAALIQYWMDPFRDRWNRCW